jgi:serine/threonine protein phosphatase 1
MPPLMMAPAALPVGRRVYAVGDVHGCASRLTALWRLVASDLAKRPVAAATLVHLGDYVDRGPDSAGVLDLLVKVAAIPGLRVVNLMGNHERMMLDALVGQDQEAAALWLDNGGAASLRSWSVNPQSPIAEWHRTIPHLDFLNRLALTHAEGPYLFVHAGVRPGVRLDRQSPRDLLWIREPFLSWPGGLGAVIVHGHTPVQEPVVRANRIGIDTGAVLGGPLTCAVIEEDRIGFLAA